MIGSFFFYDLETSGLSPRDARIMQFAGQRTDMNLKPIGDPVNVLIKLSPDVLPQPEAVLLTGITPQHVLADGMSEAEFLAYFYLEVVQPNTVFLGYNSVRFDYEFMRFLHYRNFYDAYEWEWNNGCSRWDMLDVVRMTRALRPEGISWPVDDSGKPTNRLELLSKANKLDHYKAHDALSDVYATIAIAQLIAQKQPKLFEFLLGIRKKDDVKPIVLSGQPFTYTSSHFSSQFLHTTAAVLLAGNERGDGAIVYDLRFDPTPFLSMSSEQLAAAWHYSKDPEAIHLPLKTLKYNRCPAIAPGVVKDQASLGRLQLSRAVVAKNKSILAAHHTEFASKVLAAAKQLDGQQAQKVPKTVSSLTVDTQLYDGFYTASDKSLLGAVQAMAPADLDADLLARFHDERFKQLLPLYKARNFPNSLTPEERQAWDEFRVAKLYQGGDQSQLAAYFSRLGEIQEKSTADETTQFLLEELRLYGESIVPEDVSE